MEEAKKVLEMIEQGQISAEEGMELLEALKNTEEVVVEEVKTDNVTTTGKTQYEFLRVRVTSESGATKVKVNVPISLIRALGSLASLSQFIPEDAKSNVNGVDFNAIDIDQILNAIEEGTLGDGTIVDVEAIDEHGGDKIWVKVYVD